MARGIQDNLRRFRNGPAAPRVKKSRLLQQVKAIDADPGRLRRKRSRTAFLGIVAKL
jgi:hypothetical protein